MQESVVRLGRRLRVPLFRSAEYHLMRDFRLRLCLGLAYHDMASTLSYITG